MLFVAVILGCGMIVIIFVKLKKAHQNTYKTIFLATDGTLLFLVILGTKKKGKVNSLLLEKASTI